MRAASSQFSLAHIVIFSLTHFLLHSISLSYSCSHWYVVFSITCCSLPLLSLSFVVLFTPFLHFLVLVDFVWVDFCSLVLPSLFIRGMFSYLCMLGMFSACLYYRFRVSTKFWMEKLQMVITFDRKLRLRRSKNESCSKWGNEALG